MESVPKRPPPLTREPCEMDGHVVEPMTGKKKALLIGCNYTRLKSSDVLKRPMGPEINTIRMMLIGSLGFPDNDQCITVLAEDHAAGLESVALKNEILKVSEKINVVLEGNGVLYIYIRVWIGSP